jgi:putative transposase
MGRPLRIQYPGAWYHVTSRGNERKPIFKGNEDRKRFLSYLASANERYGGMIHVYCLMDNHYHLLIETPRSNLSQILHHINGAYTNYYNAKRKRAGHLFQGRYKAIIVEKDAYFQELSRYIHLNPVRADIAERPSAYPWSSYGYYIGIAQQPEWLVVETLLGYFNKDIKEAQKDYKKFVEKVLEKEISSPLDEVFGGAFLGSEKFIEWVKEEWIEFKNADIRNIPVLKKLRGAPSLEQVERAVRSVINKNDPLYKKLCLYVSQHHVGYRLKDIGFHNDMRGSAVCQSNRRLKEKINHDKKLKRSLKDIVEMLNVET